jgi:predicted permease
MTPGVDLLRELWFRLTTGFRRDRVRRELDDELAFHREMLTRDFEQDGLTPREAAGAARRRLGSPLSLRERSAAWWGFPSLEGFGQDLRYGARMLRHSPAFTLVAVGAIAIAIGINAGFFTLIDFFIWRPYPVADASRLVRPLAVDGRGWENIRFSWPELRTITEHAATLQDAVGYDAERVALRWSPAGGGAIAGSAGCVSGNYFVALGGSAAVGRTLLPDDDRPGAPPVAVLSDAFWQQAYARSPAAVGQDLLVNGAHLTIVGVARPEFIGVNPLVPYIWMPFSLAAQVGATPGRLLDPSNRFLVIHARLRRGTSLAQASAELSGLVRDPPAAPGTRAELTRLASVKVMSSESLAPLNAETTMVAAPGLLVVGLILVIACANLATLLLARALVRQKEIAVRLALGASRRRLLRQLLTESLLIAVLGAAAGLVLADWTVTATSRSFFSFVPAGLGTVALDLRPSWRVFAYTAALALLSVLTFGLTPALQATTPRLTAALKGEDAAFGSRIRRSRFRDALVSVQVAASVVLLVAAGTLVQSLRDVANVSIGLEPRRVLVATLGMSANGNARPGEVAERARLAARAAGLPGVATVARAMVPPLASSWPLLHVAVEGAGPKSGRPPLQGLPYNVVTPGYFDVIGQRIVAGRDFTADDSIAGTAAAPGGDRVAIVTRAAAQWLWPRQAPLGQSLRVAVSDSADRIYRVVGVAADAHSAMVWDWDGSGYIYLPATSRELSLYEMPLLVRSVAGAPDPARALEELASEIDRDAPLLVDPLTRLFETQIVPFRFLAMIASAVGLLGVGLAVIGLYGVVAFTVAQRRRDVAVHIALGAATRDVLRLVLRREMGLVAIGLAAGLLMAAGEARLLSSMVLPLSALTAGGWVLLTAVLLLVALAATVLPGLAALRIAPMEVLRQE